MQFGEILRRLFLEVGEAILTAEFNLLALVDERVGLAVVEAFVGDEAFGQRIRFGGGCAVRMAGMIVTTAGAADEAEGGGDKECAGNDRCGRGDWDLVAVMVLGGRFGLLFPWSRALVRDSTGVRALAARGK